MRAPRGKNAADNEKGPIRFRELDPRATSLLPTNLSGGCRARRRRDRRHVVSVTNERARAHTRTRNDCRAARRDDDDRCNVVYWAGSRNVGR